MLDGINGSSGKSFSTETKLPRYVLSGTYGSGFSLRLMIKDMRTAIAPGEELGAPLALAERATELWELAARALPATADHTEVARWVAESPPLQSRA